MSHSFIFICGIIVMSIFAMGAYVLARVKFERLEFAKIEKPKEPQAMNDYYHRQDRTHLKVVDHH